MYFEPYIEEVLQEKLLQIKDYNTAVTEKLGNVQQKDVAGPTIKGRPLKARSVKV